MQRDKLIEPLFFGADIQFTGDDTIAILLDPFHDHRSGMIFATNPNGAEFEALITDEGSELDIDWRGVWEVKGGAHRMGGAPSSRSLGGRSAAAGGAVRGGSARGLPPPTASWAHVRPRYPTEHSPIESIAG